MGGTARALPSFLAPPISSHVLFSARPYFVERFTGLIEDLLFFFDIKQRLKRKTYSIDKEETSIMILKSFSYKIIITYV